MVTLLLKAMIVICSWSLFLVFIFFISVFSLTLAEQGTMNTNKITNKQNIVVDITFFYIFGVRHRGSEISVKQKGKDDSAIKKQHRFYL